MMLIIILVVVFCLEVLGKIIIKPPLTEQDKEDLIFLATTIRYAGRNGWSEGVRSHFSVEISSKRIAILNEDIPWSKMKSDDLVIFDLNATERPNIGVGISAFFIHQKLHNMLNTRSKAILHLHPPAATTLSTFGQLEMIHQNACYFYNDISYFEYPETGTETTESATNKLISSLHTNRILVQYNHGVLIIGESIASAFDDLFYFENACGIYIRAKSIGVPLKLIPKHTCEIVKKMRDDDREVYGRRHLLSVLKEEEQQVEISQKNSQQKESCGI